LTHRARAPAGLADPEPYRGRVAARHHQRFSAVQVTPTVTPRGDWTPEQAVDLLKRGYPLDQVITRTGYDPRWLTAQHRRLITSG